ncbi:nucleotidyltransferase family protein [Dermacoccus nishinomiyaensis]|uniref:nucleotidyltransferase family protein n=1 Tax=Dermacoccus TaxID=57495 RepID=UPI0009F9BC16|nr:MULTISPECIES: nucleotidyltransferase family protein [Dermacoccus]
MDTMTANCVEVPQTVRVRLLHAYVQLIADEVGCDLLHVKGPAVDLRLQRAARHSVDVDVLVRPQHVLAFVEALRARGWREITGFDEGSAFGHAMNLRHDLGLLDVHRWWPGFDVEPATAFEAMWGQRTIRTIAGVACDVPSLNDQRLVLLLHFARSGGHRIEDLEAAWGGADEGSRAAVVRRADEMEARLALAAAVGGLEEFRGLPAYALWKYFSSGQGSRLDEWGGRFRAARGPLAKGRVFRAFFMVNKGLLSDELGHPPTRREYVHAFRQRFVTALGDVLHRLETRLRTRAER